MKRAPSENDGRWALVTAPEAVARRWQEPAWQPVYRYLEEIEGWLQQEQMELTAVAAPTQFEGLRAEWMLQRWQGLGLAARLDGAGNVVAERPGSEPEAPWLAVTAHLDTAFAPGTAVRPERRGGRIWAPGISDNGAGLAALLALARTLQEWKIATRFPLLLVANVGEEGEGDLKGMRHLFSAESGWAERIGWTVVLDGPGTDQITTAALPSRRLRLVLEGPGGHSWSDLGRASAVHAALRVGAALLAQVQPQAQVQGCNVGWMQGGSAVNAIAAEAQLKLDLRARDRAGLEQLSQAVRRAVAAGVEQENGAALSGTATARVEVIGERPGGELEAEAPLLQLVRSVDRALGLEAEEQRASTDANIPLSQGREALRLGAGGQGGGVHTLQEWFDPQGRTVALQRVLLLVLALTQAEAPGAGRGRPRRGR
ncbi:MAG TPA: M20/M25/M40 family metallo-hydrolase [Terriglobales bacterium]|nr:M20/M25/M40 family metallo-hydrolase [Terriglobales bacterium]